MFPKWDDNYSVHNAKIDEQHKKLFELAGKVEFMFDRPCIKMISKLYWLIFLTI